MYISSKKTKPKIPSISNHQYSRFSWLWLAIGAALMIFVPAQTTIWWAAWLAPVFLLRFVRTQRLRVALPSVGIAIALAMVAAFRNDFMPLSGPDFYIAVAGIGIAYVVVFALDALLSKRFKGTLSTLAFPLASTAVGFMATFGNPVGTAGSEAYSQTNSGLLQLVSITGIWGIVFLMAWFAAIVNALWQEGFNISLTQRTLSIYGTVLLAVLAFGYARLSLVSPNTSTVRTAAISPDPSLHKASRGLSLENPTERAAARAKLDPLNNNLFSQTETEAKSGAKIIVWAEGAGRVLKEDETAYLDRAKALSTQYDIYLQIGITTLLGQDQNDSPIIENKAVLLTPQGTVAWDYHKTKVTPGDPEKSGPGVVPTIDTPYGKLATIICQDDLFPGLVSQAARKQVDILLVPSNDWEAVAKMHAHLSSFRAIENGITIVRPTSQGISLASDPLGRVLAEQSTLSPKGNSTLTAEVPVRSHTPTLYPLIGDSLAYLSLGGLLGLGGYALVCRRKAQIS